MGQSAVNIVYPVEGATYPLVDITPHGKVLSAYITASFGTTCPGGSNKVSWGFDSTTLGGAEFYDQMSVQLVQKLPAGTHLFWVESSCGKAEVKFEIA